jgi:hypothetical protein
VRSVRHEAAQLPLRRRLGLESGLDLAEHGVQRHPEPPHLGARLGALDAPGQIPRRDGGRGVADRRERSKAEPDDPEGEPTERREHRGGHEQLDEEEPVQGRLDVPERRGQNYSGVRSQSGRRAHSVAALSIARVHGEVGRSFGVVAGRRGRDIRGQRRRRHGRAGEIGDLHAADDLSVGSPELDKVAR